MVIFFFCRSFLFYSFSQPKIKKKACSVGLEKSDWATSADDIAAPSSQTKTSI